MLNIKNTFGEIILVVIGIFIALQLNTWKEKIQQKEELTASMSLMLDDLAQDISFYNSQIKKINKRISLLSTYSKGNYSKIDIETIPGEGSYNIEIKNIGATYYSLKEDRKFNLIENSKLKKIITFYYEVSCKAYIDLATWHHKFVTETIENYLVLNLPYKENFKVNAKDVIHDRENGQLLSLTNYQITIQEEALVKIKNSILLAEDMRRFITTAYH